MSRDGDIRPTGRGVNPIDDPDSLRVGAQDEREKF
jgi:hypothetical protein